MNVAVHSEEDFRELAQAARSRGYKLQSIPGDGEYQLTEVEE